MAKGRDDIIDEEVLKLYNSGVTRRELAEKYNCTYQHIYRICCGTVAHDPIKRDKRNLKSHRKCQCGKPVHPGNYFTCRQCFENVEQDPEEHVVRM